MQRKLAEDSTWPPMNRTDYAVNGKNGFYINSAYDSPDEVPKGKLKLGGPASEPHFWTSLYPELLSHLFCNIALCPPN